MIKVNLLATRKQAKAKAATGIQTEGAAGGRNLVLVGMLVLGAVAATGWWWMLDSTRAGWVAKHAKADEELKRLDAVRQKGEQYEAQKALLARKIDLITDLKKKQAVPVHILDQVSRSLPDFVWLDSMAANSNQITIAGKATTYNAVSNFYANLTQSGQFQDVTLGRVFEVPEGVSFSLTCKFAGATGPPEAGTPS